MRFRSVVSLVGLSLLAAGCSDAVAPAFDVVQGGGAGVVLAHGVRVRLAAGDTLVPRVRTRAGDLVAVPRDAHWRVGDSSIVVVDDGRIIVLRPGETTVSTDAFGAAMEVSVAAWGTTTLQRMTVTPRALSMRTGERTRLAASFEFSNGVSLALRTSATWRSLDPAVVSVNAGQLVAGAVGTARVIASSGGRADTATVSVLPPAEPAPPVSASDIAVRAQRLAAGTGTVLVSSAIPLAPGALQPGRERDVRLYLEPSAGGAPVEQPIHVAILKGRHRDGSARAVLVQFVTALDAGSGRNGRLVLGAARPASADALAPGQRPAVPAAVVLPTSPDYLVATDLVGRTQTAAATAARGGAYARYDQEFATWADYHWTASGSQWASNYYDRALIYRAMWVRTGRVDYWDRANQMALAYRRDYLEAANYASSAYWFMGEGIEQHYLATGDSASHFTIGRMGEQFIPMIEQLDDRSDWMEARNQARTLQAIFLAWRLDAQSPFAQRDWAALLDRALDIVLSTQEADGAYRWPIFCNATGNFMYGLLNDQLIDHYTYYKADPRIVTSVQRSVAYLWNTQWLSDADGFKYSAVLCPNVGGPAAAPDLTHMQSASFAWVASRTGDPMDRQRAERVFASGVAGAYYIGAKQFNEAYGSSWLALGLLP